MPKERNLAKRVRYEISGGCSGFSTSSAGVSRSTIITRKTDLSHVFRIHLVHHHRESPPPLPCCTDDPSGCPSASRESEDAIQNRVVAVSHGDS